MENLTVKLFNEIAEKQLPGLALFENRTGSGKTTGALQWVTDMLMKSKESDVIIYITPNRQNRDEAWRGLDWLDKHIEEFFATNQLPTRVGERTHPLGRAPCLVGPPWLP